MQTTRGTSLSDPHRGVDRSVGRPRSWLVLVLALIIIGLDQATKAIALATLSDRTPIELLGGVLTLRLVRNPGAAFGIAGGFTVVLSVVATAVIVVIIRVASRLTSLPWAVALSLLIGGAIGNLTDRIFRPPAPFQGHVIDFLELPNWPVFNVADSSIVCAGVLMVVLTFRGVPLTAEEALSAEQARSEEKPLTAVEPLTAERPQTVDDPLTAVEPLTAEQPRTAEDPRVAGQNLTDVTSDGSTRTAPPDEAASLDPGAQVDPGTSSGNDGAGRRD